LISTSGVFPMALNIVFIFFDCSKNASRTERRRLVAVITDKNPPPQQVRAKQTQIDFLPVYKVFIFLLY